MAINPGNSIRQIEARERYLLLDWEDTHQSVFHWVWLRFNCACEQCGDLDSGIGTLLITDIPEAIKAREVRIDELGRLHVE